MREWRWWRAYYLSVQFQELEGQKLILFVFLGGHRGISTAHLSVCSAFLFLFADWLLLVTLAYHMLLQNFGLHGLWLCLLPPPSNLNSAWAVSSRTATISFSISQFRTTRKEILTDLAGIRCWLLVHAPVTKVKSVPCSTWCCLGNSSPFNRAAGEKGIQF